MSRFQSAKERYQDCGIDVDAALALLSKTKISMHCWQGDDVRGFEQAEALSGGIATTGNYPGRPRNSCELFSDIDQALKLIAGHHKLNLHASYAVTDHAISRDALLPAHFQAWVDFAHERHLGLDFNPTFFAHPKAQDSLTLSSPNEEIRAFWIEHGKASRRIAAHFGKTLGQTALNNLWIPDGYKDIPADRYAPRARLKESLDAIFAEKHDENHLADSLESKVFGLGLESYTVGSHEFYLSYALKNDLICLLDMGHFHPSESVADKIPSLLLFFPKLALHATRPVRWDSDHVLLLGEEVIDVAKEIIRNRAMDRVFLGLDFFDASINRISAWVVGMRTMQKALLSALLMPHERLKQLQEEGNFTELMMMQEELKTYPLGDIWDHFCRQHGVPEGMAWFSEIQTYEKTVLSQRESR